ncbi:hypothetical protein SIM91_05710 [Rhodococcus opacus]|uniref:Uncharacterized protein n=1 Tax=Rhodococcus artemisiae TaxID=714159 RepID=A0ABU7LL99_9NOCA|nr:MULTISPECIES: hypothetical protein [Rhodococcus]ELB87134.1 hypothetical protein Rwratislav_41420 [Rhodococcus wratislaviensis IFP 2016]MDX5962810.1 hypothetical protein [Rhodococcus opacus]MEE2062345.1 hypothetical protein [Rhodococcus artemisiae]
MTVTAADVPPGIDQAVHEAGIASSLATLASYVDGGMTQVGDVAGLGQGCLPDQA